MLIRKNLADAYLQVSELIPALKDPWERSTLRSLQTQLATILDQGKILSSELAHLKAETSQLTILRLAKEAEVKSIFFTRESTLALKRRVESELKRCESKSPTTKYQRFLREVHIAAQCTLDDIKILPSPDESKIHLSDRDLNLLMVTTIYGGKYIPFNQALDPLCGQIRALEEKEYKSSEGECVGRVLAWRDEIKAQGRFLLLSRLDHRTQTHLTAPEKSNYIMMARSENSTMLPETIHSLLKKIVTYHIYEIGFLWKESGSQHGHSTGIRRISVSGEIEFIDPNLGLFVFSSSDHFKTWFTWVINAIYSKGLMFFELSIIGIQPLTAVSSLPIVKVPMPSKGYVTLCNILADLIELEKDIETTILDKQMIFKKIKTDLKSVEHMEGLKSEITRIKQKINTLEIYFLQERLFESVLMVSKIQGVLKPILIGNKPTRVKLQEIVNLSFQCQESHGSAIRFLFWKYRTPTNDFYEVMKNLNIDDRTQLIATIDKLDKMVDPIPKPEEKNVSLSSSKSYWSRI